MEDIFQIVFILIFILSSIASSLSKKKKKQQQAKSKIEPTVKKPTNTSQSKQRSSSQILEEILGLKIPQPEPQKKEAPISYFEETTWDPTAEFEEQEKEVRLSDYKEITSAKKTSLSEDKNKHRAFKGKRKRIRKKNKSSIVEKLFTDQTNLKDYIVIQEILNKPKALRR